MFADYHVHSNFSDDSIYPMEKVVQDAIKMHMEEICFTDHVDYGIKHDWEDLIPTSYRHNEPLLNVDYEYYVREISRLQKIYGDKIKIKLGLEFGMQVPYIQKYEQLFVRYPFDFILLSIHQVDNQEFWTGDYQKGKSRLEVERCYYEEMLELVKKYKNYSVLAHMDLISRYDKNGSIDFEYVQDLIEKILKIVIEDHKGIEINTSYHRYGLSEPTPSLDILKLYKNLGGTILTIGSDSHKEEHLGAYYNEALELVKSLGFESICTFEHMTPIFHKI